MWQRLEAAERRAKEARRGGWSDEYHRPRGTGLATPPSLWASNTPTNAPAAAEPEKVYRQKLDLVKSAVFFDPEKPGQPAGWLRPGTTVIVLRAGPEGLICVRVDGDATKRELLCRPADIGL